MTYFKTNSLAVVFYDTYVDNYDNLLFKLCKSYLLSYQNLEPTFVLQNQKINELRRNSICPKTKTSDGEFFFSILDIRQKCLVCIKFHSYITLSFDGKKTKQTITCINNPDFLGIGLKSYQFFHWNSLNVDFSIIIFSALRNSSYYATSHFIWRNVDLRRNI